METIKLARAEERFSELDYPVTRTEAATAFAEVQVAFADGEANLGRLLSEVGSDVFHGPDELYAELQNVVPVEAVGEPGQSEGEG